MVNPEIQLIISNLVNFINFFVFITAPYVIFYFAQEAFKRISLSIFLMALGLDFIGISYLIRILVAEVEPHFVLGLLSLGALLILASILHLFYTKALETAILTKRRREIRSMIKEFKKKFYAKEIGEDDLKSAYSDLFKELVEIETKLKKKRK
ncbi:MAG: hypothetical protein QW818_00385 [Candidatus Aenigmatarchaeota archaeon]